MVYIFAGWNRAGDARAGSQGRPGLNPLRFHYVVDSETMKDLRNVCSKLSLWSEALEDGKEVHME